MILRNRNLLFKSGNFKNILLLCLMFVISTLVIGFFAYKEIDNYVTQLSRQDIVEEFDDLLEIHDESGFAALKVELDEEDPEDEIFFARILQDDLIVSQFFPNDWERFQISNINKSSISIKYIWHEYKDQSGSYEYMSYNISDKLVLQIGHSIEERNEFLGFINKIFISGFIIVFIITIIFGIFIADRSIIPVTNLMNTTDKIILQNDFKQQVDISGLDPLHTDLAGKFNYMLQRIDKLIYGMRGTLDNIAHDIRTPLTRLRLSAEYSLYYGEDVQSLKESLRICIEESDRIADFFNSFLEIAQASSGSLNLKMELIRINELVDKVVELYDYVAEEKNITIKIDIDDSLEIMLDRVKMTLVLSNIIDNAIKYSEDNSEVLIQSVKNGDRITLNIVDTGIGIDSTEIDKIWEKLYRSGNGSSIKGYGLGLSYAKAVINAHNGDIRVRSKLNSGSTFSIDLPC